MTDNTLLEGYVDGKALFRTNIPGITYAIGLYPAGKALPDGFRQFRSILYDRLC